MQLVFIGRAHRVVDELVAHMAAVDKQVLQVAAGPRHFGLAHPAQQAQRAALSLQVTAGGHEFQAQDIAEPVCRAAGTPLGHQTAFVPHRKAHIGPRQGVAAHGLERV